MLSHHGGALLTQGWLTAHQDSQVLLCNSALVPHVSAGKWKYPCPGAGHGISLYELQEIPIGPFLPEGTMAEQVHT